MFSILVKIETVKPQCSGDLHRFLERLVELYEVAAHEWKGLCPTCGRALTRHGSYLRKTPTVFKLKLSIKRVICKHCGITHALIPCFLIPYARYLDVDIEFALNPEAYAGITVEQLAECISTEPSTILRWRANFRAKAHDIYLRLAKLLAMTSLPVTKWLWTGSLDPPERRIFNLISVLRKECYDGFSFSNLALLNLLFPLS